MFVPVKQFDLEPNGAAKIEIAAGKAGHFDKKAVEQFYKNFLSQTILEREVLVKKKFVSMLTPKKKLMFFLKLRLKKQLMRHGESMMNQWQNIIVKRLSSV